MFQWVSRKGRKLKINKVFTYIQKHNECGLNINPDRIYISLGHISFDQKSKYKVYQMAQYKNSLTVTVNKIGSCMMSNYINT